MPNNSSISGVSGGSPGQLLTTNINSGAAGWNFISAAPQNSWSISPSSPPSSIVIMNNSAGAEIVRLNKDGTVTWANGINEDEAAKSFSRSISLGAEIVAGVTKKVKQDMRDIVFEEIIAIAKDKGSLTAEDLTYLYRSAKIVDKLKGSRE